MSPEWLNIINQEMAKDYMIQLKSFIDSERQSKVVYPEPQLTFNHMAMCPYDKLKVVIIGDSPFNYPVNDGMAFSAYGVNPPEDNKNIIYEAYMDYFSGWQKSQSLPKNKIFPTNQLTEWAKQGVLLINSIYTCTQADIFAHAGKGWEMFNEVLISFLNEYEYPLVFINKSNNLNYNKLINVRKHLIISNNDDKWSTKANEFIKNRPVSFLLQHKQLSINWSTNNFNL